MIANTDHVRDSGGYWLYLIEEDVPLFQIESKIANNNMFIITKFIAAATL